MNSVAAQPVLDVRDLTISYVRRRRHLRVLSELTFHIAPGEAYGLVGESGCGKTTAAMAVVRYLPTNAIVEHGRINFLANDLLHLTDDELRKLRGDRIAMVYQDPASALNPSMQIGGQIAEVYRFHRDMSRRESLDAARGMLETVRMPNAPRLLRRYPHQLSGGQQQRVMIAMALATDPDLLVLDEPTTGLDATVEAEVLDLVASLREEFKTAILFISHNLGTVARLCDRIGVLYAGRLVEEGSARETLLDPRHPYTLGLIRSAPRRGMSKDSQRLTPIAGSLPPLGTEIPGCVYAERCPIVRDTCREQPIPLSALGSRLTRCLYPEDVPNIPVAASSGETADRVERTVLLRGENLSKTYASSGARVTAVDNVSFEVRRGEVFGLVGESGSGKTSLARCVAGLSSVSQGRLTLEGRPIPPSPRRREDELRRKIQIVFQNPDGALNPRLSTRRILLRAIKRLSPSGSRTNREARLQELAQCVRLREHHLNETADRLSGGLKQRVAIARALAGEPLLVVCDEPTSALDVSVQAVILNLLLDIQNRSRVSYIFISHDLATVRYLADRVGVMYLGQLVETGTTDEVFSPPFHPYTEALLSAIPAIDRDEGSTRITLTGSVPDPANPPSGCRFHTRCPRYLGDICREQEPPWQEAAAGHSYKCHIPPGELAEAQRSVESGASHVTPRVPRQADRTVA